MNLIGPLLFLYLPERYFSDPLRPERFKNPIWIEGTFQGIYEIYGIFFQDMKLIGRGNSNCSFSFLFLV